MRVGGGSRKGSAFEREICKQLSLWVSRGKHEDLFWRTAMSGGRATVGKQRGKALSNQAGDVCAVGRAGHQLTNTWYIECKHVSSLQPQGLVYNRGGFLLRFWNTAMDEAVVYKKLPMLIARQNRFPTLLVLPYHMAPCEGVYPLVESVRHNMSVWEYEGYLKTVSFKAFSSLMRKYL